MRRVTWREWIKGVKKRRVRRRERHKGDNERRVRRWEEEEGAGIGREWEKGKSENKVWGDKKRGREGRRELAQGLERTVGRRWEKGI